VQDTSHLSDAAHHAEVKDSMFYDMVMESQNGYYRCDLNDKFIFVNPAMARLHGCKTVVQFMQKFTPTTCFADPAAAAVFFESLRRSSALSGTQNVRRKVNGTTFYSWETAQTRMNANGRASIIDGTIVDVSARTFLDNKIRQSEQALVSKIEQLQSTLDAMEQGVCVYDKDHHLVAWNKCFRNLISTLGNVNVGMPLKRQIDHLTQLGVFGSGDPSKVSKAELKRIIAGAFDDVEVQRAHDGRVFEVHRHSLEGGGYLATYTDVTERDRTRDELQAAREIAEIANLSKTNYIAFLGHEFRTPLNSVLAFAEMLKDETYNIEKVRMREYAGYIYDSGNRLLTLLNDVLDLSRLETGEQEIQAENLDAKELFESIARLMGLEFEKRGITYTVNIPDACPPVSGDARSVKQVILNVLSNAAKFTPPHGRVTVSVRPVGRRDVVIEIADTGPGIDNNKMSQLLNPFSRSMEDLTISQQGSGLGLPICNYLMDMHGGRIQVDSVVDRGTTVTLFFPGDYS